MNKKFLSAILFGALVASAGSFVSCADNDDKIDQLQGQNDQLKAELAKIQAELKAELKNAATAAQVAAIEAKLSLVEGATPENIASTVAALTGDFMTKEAVGLAIEAQIQALEALQNADTAAVIEALNKAKERDNTDIEKLSAMIDAFDADVNILVTAVRALVFQPEFYLDGIEAAEYTYLRYAALDAECDQYEGDKLNFDGNAVSISKDFTWRYAHIGDIDEICPEALIYAKSTSTTMSVGSGVEKSVGEGVPNYVKFAVNPSNAKLDLNMVIKNICAMTRADVADVIYAKECAREGNIVTVQYEIKNPRALITANYKEEQPGHIFTKNNENTSVFKLIAATNDGQNVESDWGVLYETSVQPVAIAKVKNSDWYAPIACTDNELHKNPYEALADVPTFKLAYNDAKGVDMAKNIELHFVKRDNEKTDAKQGHINVSLEDAAIKYGLTYEFIPVPYTAGGNKTEDTNYSTLTDGAGVANVVANIVDETTGAAKTGVQGESSVGKQPLYQILVKKGNDVVLDAYVKIIISRTVAPIVSEALPLGTKDYYCSGIDFTSTWYQFSTIVLQNAFEAAGLKGMSKEEFVAKYELNVNSANEAIQYADAKGTLKSDLYTAITEIKDPKEPTNNVLTFALDENAQQYIIEKKEGKSDIIYVKYVSKDDRYADMGIDPEVYVPLQFALNNVALEYTYGIKNINFWYAADGKPNIEPDEALRFNVNYPEDNKNTKLFVRDLNDAWEGKKLALSGASSTKKQYYFHPLTNGVKVTDEYNGAVYTLSVESDEVLCHMWNANHTEKVTDNINALETEHKVYVGYGIYNNNVLKATDGKVTEVIATLNQETGIVDYKNDSELAKKVLNAVTHSKAEAKAYVGLVAADNCDHAIAIKDNVFPVYFLRPIDIKGGKSSKVIDAKANADYVSLFDMFTFTDWRDVDFFNKEANDYKNVWLLAYYNVNTITVDLENILTDMNHKGEKNPLAKINNDVKVSYVEHDKTTPIVGAWPLNLSAYNKESMGVKSTYEKIVNHFGYLKYENKGANVSDFTLYVPVTFGYDWGTITKTVEIYVEGSMANHVGE